MEMMRLIRRIAKSPSLAGMTVLGLFVLLSCAANSAFAQLPVPLMVDYFDTGGFGATSPNGVTFISSGPYAGNYATVDDTPDAVFIADRNGILKHQINVPVGTTATGVAFMPDTQYFAVTDSILDEVFIFNAAGSLQSNFDTAAFGCSNPQGITFITEGSFTGNFAIVDSTADVVFIVSGSGSLVGSFSTGGFGAVNPTGIAYMPGAGTLAVIDDSLDDVFIVDFSGLLQRQFDVGFVSTSSLGVAYEPSSGIFPVASANLNQPEIFFIDGDGEVATIFSTLNFSSTQATGITYIPTTQQYAIVDMDTDRVYFVNTDGSNPTSCSINAFSTSPMGITYIPQTGNLAIVDDSADEVFIIDQNCNLLSQFDTKTFGVNIVYLRGIASIPGGKSTTGQFDILSYSSSGVKRVDPAIPGRIQSQFGTNAFNFNNPEGITQIDGTGNLAMVDNSKDDAFITDSRGVLLALFDTAPFSANPRGIAFDSDTGTIAIVDPSSDLVTILDLPGLLLLPELCACDLNNDGKCNILDYQLFIQDWGCTTCP
jgi:DNA-binding beta-propeller fold protein YncE